jgi:nitronate monooxygenase
VALPALLRDNLSIPVVGAPLFIVSNPDLVIEQCKAGIVGSFPALNARPKEVLEEWLQRITTELREYKAKHPDRKVAPFAVNQIVHSSNDRLQHDIDLCEKYKVPIQITSLRAPDDVVKSAKRYGCLVFHDVTNVQHAKRALQAGVDGLILVCAGAGGHAGMLSPLALVHEVRRFYSGTIVLSGAIAHGASILAAQAIGADLAYIGTRFIASAESAAQPGYKQMLVETTAADVVYTSYFSGVPGNYLKPSVRAAGLDPDNLPSGDKTKMSFASDRERPKVWKDIWSAGQGLGLIDDVPPVAEIVARLKREYDEARAWLCR